MTALHSLIGQDVNCESVQATIRWLGPFHSSIQDLAPDENMRPDHYLTNKAGGIQLRHAPSGTIEVIFLYGAGRDGFSEYRGPLEGGITFASTAKDIVAALGTPQFHKPERNRPLLGKVGETVRYDLASHSIGFQMALGGQGVSLVTISAPRARGEA
jgi:hypothetical protein